MTVNWSFICITPPLHTERTTELRGLAIFGSSHFPRAKKQQKIEKSAIRRQLNRVKMSLSLPITRKCASLLSFSIETAF